MNEMTCKVAGPQYLFHGVVPACIENRFIEISIDKDKTFLNIHEFFLDSGMKLSTKSTTKSIALPECLRSQRIIDLTVDYIQCFEDTEHFFLKDSAAVRPLRCHINHDKSSILLRLPQNIASPKRWTTILRIKTAAKNVPISTSNPVLGTEKQNIHDRKFQALLYQPDGNVLTADLEEYLSRYQFTIYGQGLECGKMLSQKCYHIVHNVELDDNNSGLRPHLDSDSDDLEEEDVTPSFHINQSSMCYNRNGDLLIIYCICQNYQGQEQCKIDFFKAATLEHINSETFPIKSHNTTKQTKQSVPFLFSLILSPCDTQLDIWRWVCGSHSKTVIKRIQLPVVKPNEVSKLKKLCRRVILMSMNVADLKLSQSLPTKIMKYLHFRE